MSFQKACKCGIVCFLILLLLFPEACIAGAKQGLLLWFQTVLPTLFPFMLLSKLMVTLRMSTNLSWWFYPVLHRLFGCSREGCYPIIIGMFSGYPVGAAAVADLKRQHRISSEEGNFLLCLCNNASPMFLLEFTAAFCLGLATEKKYLFFCIILCSAVISSLLVHKCFRGVSHFHSPTPSGDSAIRLRYKRDTGQAPLASNGNSAQAAPPRKITSGMLLPLLDETIMKTLEILVKTGAYIIIFSLLANVLLSTPFLPPPFLATLGGVLEITSGSSILHTCIDAPLLRLVIISGITGFGGLSATAQTFSVIHGCGLSGKTYFLCKMLNGIICALLAWVFHPFLL